MPVLSNGSPTEELEPCRFNRSSYRSSITSHPRIRVMLCILLSPIDTALDDGRYKGQKLNKTFKTFITDIESGNSYRMRHFRNAIQSIEGPQPSFLLRAIGIDLANARVRHSYSNK